MLLISAIPTALVAFTKRVCSSQYNSLRFYQRCASPCLVLTPICCCVKSYKCAAVASEPLTINIHCNLLRLKSHSKSTPSELSMDLHWLRNCYMCRRQQGVECDHIIEARDAWKL